MTWMVTTACVICGWAMLRLMGSERMQMVRAMEIVLREEEAKKTAAAALAAPAAEQDKKPASASTAGSKR